jgi:solute carrier family 25 2-oxodicarboxylate transporter 21
VVLIEKERDHSLIELVVVKTRFQLQVGKGSAGAEHYTSTIDCFRKIIKNEGLAG